MLHPDTRPHSRVPGAVRLSWQGQPDDQTDPAGLPGYPARGSPEECREDRPQNQHREAGEASQTASTRTQRQENRLSGAPKSVGIHEAQYRPQPSPPGSTIGQKTPADPTGGLPRRTGPPTTQVLVQPTRDLPRHVSRETRGRSERSAYSSAAMTTERRGSSPSE